MGKDDKKALPSELLTGFERLPFLPCAREAKALDRMFEEGANPVAGYVSRTNLTRLRKFMK